MMAQPLSTSASAAGGLPPIALAQISDANVGSDLHVVSAAGAPQQRAEEDDEDTRSVAEREDANVQAPGAAPVSDEDSAPAPQRGDQRAGTGGFADNDDVEPVGH